MDTGKKYDPSSFKCNYHSTLFDLITLYVSIKLFKGSRLLKGMCQGKFQTTSTSHKQCFGSRIQKSLSRKSKYPACLSLILLIYLIFHMNMLHIHNRFYEAFGMTVVGQKNYGDFSNFFLASSSNVDESVDYSSLSDDEAKTKLSMMFGPILELTHNHGTEEDGNFKHFNGNEEGKQGFGHIGFLVDDVYTACDTIREMGYGFKKEPDGGSMKGLAFAYDPDGYSIEIIKRGGIEFGDKKVES